MSIVINCYCELKKVDLGFSILASFVKRGYSPNVVSTTCLIKGLFLKGNVNRAVELFKKTMRDKSFEVNGITYLTVLDGLSKSGNVVSAVELLEVLERKNCEVGVAGYTAVIDGLCKARMLEDAMKLRMIDRDILPNIVTYTALIYGLCSHKKLDFALSIFNDLPSKKIYPDVVTYTVMIQGFCQEGLFPDAKEMLEQMERVGCFPNSVTYNIVIQGCLKHPDNIYSVNLFKQIIGREFQQDARTFFMLLSLIHRSYGDVTINNWTQKLISGDSVDQMLGSSVNVMVNSLVQKFGRSIA